MQKEKETVNIVTTIAEYSTTAAELAKLKAKLAGAKYEVTTTAGMDTAKKDRRELVTLRTSLEAKRKEIKAPALERCKQIDEEAKRITAELLALEQPIDAQIKAEEARKEAIAEEKRRIEAERIAAIRTRINQFPNLVRMALTFDSAAITEHIAKIEAKQLSATDYAELLPEAEAAKVQVVADLREMLAARVEQEEAAAKAEAERVEREAAEAIERERVKAEQEAEAARLEEIRIENEKAAAERDRLNAIEAEKIAAERAELAKLREAEESRQKEAEEKARAEREESDRIAAEERAAAQAIIDAERAELKRQADKLEAARLAEEKRKADEEAAKIKPLVSGYSIVIKNAGKGRFVGLWLDEKNVEQYRTGKAHDTEEQCLAMVKSFISGEGRI